MGDPPLSQNSGVFVNPILSLMIVGVLWFFELLLGIDFIEDPIVNRSLLVLLPNLKQSPESQFAGRVYFHQLGF